MYVALFQKTWVQTFRAMRETFTTIENVAKYQFPEVTLKDKVLKLMHEPQSV